MRLIDADAVIEEIKKNKLLSREAATMRVVEIIKDATTYVQPTAHDADNEAMQVKNMKISYFPHSSLIKNIYGECPMCHSMQIEDNFCANCGQRLSFKIAEEET